MNSAKQVEKEVKKIAAAIVGDAMTTDPVCVDPDADIEAVASLMVDKNFHTIPVGRRRANWSESLERRIF